jgi:hypothetical protein
VLPNAFSDCDNLHTVVWNCPSTVLNHYRPGALTMNFNYIGIFEDCNIRNFVFGDSIRIIESGALYRFENIRSVTLGDNINRIDVLYFPVCDTIISRNIKLAADSYYYCNIVYIRPNADESSNSYNLIASLYGVPTVFNAD